MVLESSQVAIDEMHRKGWKHLVREVGNGTQLRDAEEGKDKVSILAKWVLERGRRWRPAG